MADGEQVATALRTAWHRVPMACQPMSPNAWLVTAPDGRYVAKLVPATRRAQFEAGLAAAETLAAAGITAGAPIRTEMGALTETIKPPPGAAERDTVLGLLRFVPGRPLDAQDSLDQQWWGGLLGAAHRALVGFAHPGLARWHWVRPDAAHLDIEDWVRPAVAEAVAALTKLSVTDQLTYGVLHGSPAPGACRLDVPTGRIGLVGWRTVTAGPLAYDVAAAVMYAGRQEHAEGLLEAYAAAGPMSRDEIDASLPTLLRFRWAVQVDRLARRIFEDHAVAGAGVGLAAGLAVGLELGQHWARLRQARNSLGAR